MFARSSLAAKMEARIKKIFHRKRDDASEPSVIEDHSSDAENTNSALRTSLYDLTIPREPPQTGTLPFQGNSTRLSPTHISSISAGGPTLLSPRGPPHESVEASTILGSGRDHLRLSEQLIEKDGASLLKRSDGRQKTLPEIPVSPLSPKLNVGNDVCQFLPGACDLITKFQRSSETLVEKLDASRSKSSKEQGSGLFYLQINPCCILISTIRTMMIGGQIGSTHPKR